MRTLSIVLMGLAAAGYTQAQESAAARAPQKLRCESLVEPMAVDAVPPRLSWMPVGEARGAVQTAYQIQVSKEAAVAPGEVWDSGRVQSAQSVHVPYGGPGLESGQTYYWRVRYWDDRGAQSGWSRPARIGVGLLNRADWKGKFIGGGNALRKEFSVAGRVVEAKAFIAGVGYYELRINGVKIGDHVLDPAYTPFAKRIFYEAYDVTQSVRQGDNAVGVMLGEGWFGNRLALVQINVELEGGRKVEFHSDESWQAGQSPILEDSVYHGERYDARLEQEGWDRPKFEAAGWKEAVAGEQPKAELSAQMMPPVRVVGDITPPAPASPKQGVWVYDMGQNFSGWVKLKVRGPRGTTVRMRHAELLYDTGMVNVENLRSARATDYYTLRGDGEETWEPRFTYHGFRYVELTGYPGAPPMDAVTGRVVHSDVKPAGGFAASKPVLNRIQRLVEWGITSNLHSIPTDCNQRDERMGWMADAHLSAEAAMMNFDMEAFYRMWLRSMRDDQAEDGSVPDTVPRSRYAQGPADPAWGSAYPLILWYSWEQYGDRGLLAQHFEGIRRWSDFLWSRSEGGILNFVKFGDWVPLEKTPGNLVSTAYSYWSADIVAKVAAVLGKSAEEQAYRQRAEQVKQAFHGRFFNAELGVYGNGSQTSNVLALYLDLVPPNERGRVRGNLNHDLIYKWNSHLSTGIHGTKYLLPYLTRTGAADLAYDIATRTDYPSWGYMLENGATTVWELWQKREGPSMNSHNHPALTSIGGWFMTELAGISMQTGGAGYEKVLIRPQVVRDLQWASGSMETVRGAVASAWTRSDEGLKLEVTIPFGSSAEIQIPKLQKRGAALSEGGTLLMQNRAPKGSTAGVNGVRETDSSFVVQAGGGRYSFEMKGW
ncbi:MAG: family 78 glycoside hydrolase catalytic domain [Candidatus Solibacter usitatus]|nr:family 78 glycoside hydrolase catalytic domain [Candidatus Solibacter usitatus]